MKLVMHWGAALFCTASLAFAAAAGAQSYPSKPVHIIVPFPPGGGLDTVTRTIQPRLSEYLGQPIIIENKAGAAGLVGTTQAARSAPDGYTLLGVFDTYVVNQHLYKDSPDIFAAFDAVTMMVSTPQLLIAGAQFPGDTLAAMVTLAKSKPEKLTYGSLGSGSSNHLGALLLSQRAGMEMVHVPFKGGAPLVQAMLGNHIDVTFTFPSGVIPHIKSGKIKALAVAGKQRLPQLPDVPTIDETFREFELISWFGIVAPKGVPREAFDRIQRELRRALGAPEVKEKLIASGYVVNANSPEEFSAFLRSESEKMAKLIRDYGVKVE